MSTVSKDENRRKNYGDKQPTYHCTEIYRQKIVRFFFGQFFNNIERKQG